MIGVCKQVAVLMFVLKLPSSSHVESFSSGFIPRISERFGNYMSAIALEATSPLCQ